jgi:formylglycine-generating enzyme required for sulfatase activity
VCRDAALIWGAIEDLRTECGEAALQEFVTGGFLRESPTRYHEHVEPLMRRIGGTRFEMGTREEDRAHHCGESPARSVWVSPFECARVPVTNALMSLFDRRRADVPGPDRRKPATGVTWHEAAVFAAWMGCRLPTESECEFACGAGSLGEWCCDDEDKLARYAWYSETAGDALHEVGMLEANQLDLFDLHGNVWEWCADDFDQDAYAAGASADPLHRHAGADADGFAGHRVCRGGSFLSLAEMCRTRYRQHEPAGFRGRDLGFRLARSAPGAAPNGDR